MLTRGNLYEVGPTTFDAIYLIVAVERAFKVEFTRQTPKQETLASVEVFTKTVRAMRRVSAIEVRRAA
jgi:hypothetical protein